MSPDHIGWLLICALRYSLGRQTYASELTPKIIRAEWGNLFDSDREVIERDLTEAIRRDAAGAYASSLGAECDRKSWHDLAAWIARQKEVRR